MNWIPVKDRFPEPTSENEPFSNVALVRLNHGRFIIAGYLSKEIRDEDDQLCPIGWYENPEDPFSDYWNAQFISHWMPITGGAAMKWMSVKSALPDDADQACIVCLTHDYYGDWVEGPYTYSDYEWWDSEGQPLACKVSHWMPITPPEKDDE